MEKLLEVADLFLKMNPSLILTGSLMLKLRGYDLGREPHDIDLVGDVMYYDDEVVLPEGTKILSENLDSMEYCDIKVEYNGIIIDIMYSDEDFEEVDGRKLSFVEELIYQKRIFAQQDNDAAQKHKDDIINLGFPYPKEGYAWKEAR